MAKDENDLELLGDVLEVGDPEQLMNNEEYLKELEDEGYIAENSKKFLEEAVKYPDSLMYLYKAYVDFAITLITERAIPAIDGLKPAQRRIMVVAKEFYDKRAGFIKSKKIMSDVIGRLHPHGDCYDVAVKMVDSRNAFNVPLIKGTGNFGSVFSSKSASAQRYTEMQMHDNAKEFFGEMNGVKYRPSFDEKETEPILLPVSYPSILVNSTNGIAVGISSYIPSFNISDVIDATIEYMETGDIAEPLIPDFPSGGTYVQNDEELWKIMETGVGKIKMRGNVEIDGSEIIIKDLPYGVTAEKIMKQVAGEDGLMSNEGSRYIDDIKNLTGRNGFKISVYCSNANYVQTVLMLLYKKTDLQTTVTTQMNVIVDGKPELLGVKGIIREWCRFRKDVIVRQTEHDKSKLEKSLKISKAKYLYTKETDIVDKVIELLRAKKRAEARDYLQECFTELDKDDIKTLLGMSISSLGDNDVFESEIQEYTNKIEVLNKRIADPSPAVIEDLRRVQGYYKSYKRHTLISDRDYVFETKEEVVIDNSPCYVLIKDNFIKKVTRNSYFKEENYDLVLDCKASDTLLGIDNFGRVIRVYLKDIEYTTSDKVGTYLPQYLDLDDSFDLLWLDLLTEATKMLIYSDGRIGMLDMSEWYGNSRCVKVIEKGVSAEVDKLIGVIDVPETLIVYTSKGRCGIEYLENIIVKSRTARKLTFKLEAGERITAYAPLTKVESIKVLSNHSKYSVRYASDTFVRPRALDFNDLTDSEGVFIQM